MKLSIIIPAAGASRRFNTTAPGGPERSKLDEDLGGRPLLHRTVELFSNRADVALVVVAGPADPHSMAAFKLRHADRLALLGVVMCAGGAEHRWQTVRNALAQVPNGQGFTHVAVHDAARPCASQVLIDRLVQAAERHKAVVPGYDVSDTLKRVDPAPLAETSDDPLAAILGTSTGGSPNRRVVETLFRDGVVAVQTPQIFEIGLLRRAYAQSDLASTDDAQLVERLGETVVVVEGERTNLKVTHPGDIELARRLLGLSGPSERAAHKKF
jgi:2-C-methyl-D-erythritol 4-phosphate cytidylyltransferase